MRDISLVIGRRAGGLSRRRAGWPSSVRSSLDHRHATACDARSDLASDRPSMAVPRGGRQGRPRLVHGGRRERVASAPLAGRESGSGAPAWSGSGVRRAAAAASERGRLALGRGGPESEFSDGSRLLAIATVLIAAARSLAAMPRARAGVDQLRASKSERHGSGGGWCRRGAPWKGAELAVVLESEHIRRRRASSCLPRSHLSVVVAGPIKTANGEAPLGVVMLHACERHRAAGFERPRLDEPPAKCRRSRARSPQRPRVPS